MARKKTPVVEKPTITAGMNDIYGQDDIIEQLTLAAEHNKSSLIIGETGTGKTTVVKHIAEKFGKEWIRFNLTGETTVDDFVGKWTLKKGDTVWQDGILLQAMRAGKWLIVDEINVALPEILFALHSLLDDDKYVVVAQKDGEVVRPHEDFRFFATMNPVDEYAGTKELNKAFKSRFDVIAVMEYPEFDIETKVVMNKTGVDEGTAKQIVLTAHEIRRAKQEEKVFYTCSTRDLMQWASLYILNGNMGKSFRYTVLNKANGDGDMVKKIYEDMNGKLTPIRKKTRNLSLKELQDKIGELEQAELQLETHRDRFKEEITGEVLLDLRKKLGALTDVVSTADISKKVDKLDYSSEKPEGPAYVKPKPATPEAVVPSSDEIDELFGGLIDGAVEETAEAS